MVLELAGGTDDINPTSLAGMKKHLIEREGGGEGEEEQEDEFKVLLGDVCRRWGKEWSLMVSMVLLPYVEAIRRTERERERDGQWWLIGSDYTLCAI